MKFVYTLLTVFLFVYFSQAKTITWAGQFPKEQAEPVVKLFNEKYSSSFGFKVKYESDNAVIENVLQGNPNDSIDLVHLKDADTLNEIRNKKLTARIYATSNIRNIPRYLYDQDMHWTGILKRLRIIYYNSDQVSESDVKSYEDLAKTQFKNKLCLRQAKAQYTIGFHSFLLGIWGPEKTSQILKQWAINSESIPLLEKDLDHIIANVESGTCSVGIANTYYFARHIKNNPNTKVKFIFPNIQDIGSHINVDGVAVLKQSENYSEANQFISWLISPEAQLLLSEITDKFPVNVSVVNPSLQKLFPNPVENQTFNLNKITNLKDEAFRLSKEAGLK